EVLKTHTTDEGLFLWTTTLLRGQRRFLEAEKVIGQAESIFPVSLRIRIERGWLLFHQKRYSEALDEFEEVLKVDNGNESALQGRIASLRMRGCFLEADASLKDALMNHDKSAGIRSESAWLNFDKGKLDMAIADFTKTLALAPKDSSSHINLA